MCTVDWSSVKQNVSIEKHCTRRVCDVNMWYTGIPVMWSRRMMSVDRGTGEYEELADRTGKVRQAAVLNMYRNCIYKTPIAIHYVGYTVCKLRVPCTSLLYVTIYKRSSDSKHHISFDTKMAM